MVAKDVQTDLDKGDTKDVPVRLRKPMVEALDKLADFWQWTRSRVIEEACKRLLENYGME